MLDWSPQWTSGEAFVPTEKAIAAQRDPASRSRSCALVLLAVAALWPGSGLADAPPSAPNERPTSRLDSQVVATIQTAAQAPYVETGDLEAIQRRGRLRILTLAAHAVHHGGSPEDADERALATEAAKALGLGVDWIELGSRQALVEALQTGQGDVVISPLPVGPRQMPPGIASTLPLGTLKYQVVTRRDLAARARDLASLGSRPVLLPPQSPAWVTLDGPSRPPGGPAPTALAPHVDEAGALRALAAGESDAVIVPDTAVRDGLAEHDNLAVAFDVTASQPVGWYVRASSERLRAALDEHLERAHLAFRPRETWQEDLPGLARRGVLRAIVRPDATNFYLVDGAPRGLAHDILADFALRRGLRLEFQVANSDEEMLRWLAAGRGDLIATPVPGGADVRRSMPFHYVAPTVVTRAWDPIGRLEDLAGRRLLLAAGSPHARAVDGLRAAGIEVTAEVIGRASDAALLDRIADAGGDVAVVDGFRASRLLAARPDLRAAVSLPDPWAWRFTMRAEAPLLAEALDAHLHRLLGGELLATLVDRYVERPGNVDLSFSRISPFDELVRTSAARHGFDWRLILSVMYQESQFDPRARSPAGALGLMQVLPSTAASLGIRNLADPRSGILAGVRYLEELRDRFGEELALKDRTWFAVAAYHGGYSRVHAARREAARLGLDPDRWFGHVEQAMERLAEAGGTRGRRGALGRTVHYVRAVRARFDTYVQVTAPTLVARDPMRRSTSRS